MLVNKLNSLWTLYKDLHSAHSDTTVTVHNQPEDSEPRAAVYLLGHTTVAAVALMNPESNAMASRTVSPCAQDTVALQSVC